MVAFVESVPGVLPVPIQFECLKVHEMKLFELIGFELNASFTQIMLQRARVMVHVEPNPTTPKFDTNRGQPQVVRWNTIIELSKELRVSDLF